MKAQRRFSVIVVMLFAVMLLFGAARISHAATAAQLNLSSEGQVIDNFVEQLISYNTLGSSLAKKMSLVSSELVSYNSSADALKRQLPQVQQAARSLIDKLKQSGQWDNLDKTVIAETKDSKLVSYWTACGGAQRVIQDVAAGNGLMDELTAGLNVLQPKVKAQMVQPLVLRAAGSDALMDNVVPVSFGGGPGFACRVALLRVRVSTVINGGNASNRSTAAAECSCPLQRDATVNPFIDCGSTR